MSEHIQFKDQVYREVKPATKKEVTACATALNEENEKLTSRIKVLESEVRGLKKVESWKYKAWKDFKWWYGMNLQDGVNRIAVASAWVLLGVYCVYKLGMEFIPTVMGPLSSVVGRALSAIFSF
jgi:hypothetical protein